MQPLDSKTIKLLELNMLKVFSEFCDEKGYTYFLGGGTLLGAVRHKGFIPWDDDIDIMMPRPDYEMASKEFSHEYIKVFTYDDDSGYTNEWSALGDNRTYRVGDLKESGCVYLDVFPIDGLPNNKIKQKILFVIKAIVFFLRLASVKKYGQTGRYTDRDAGILNLKKHIRNTIKTFMITVFGWTSFKWWAKLLDILAQRVEFGTTKYAGAILGCNGMKEIMPICLYEEKVKLEFEGEKYWAPKMYHLYLSSLYNDYMKIPPKAKQVSHHLYKFYWREEV